MRSLPCKVTSRNRYLQVSQREAGVLVENDRRYALSTRNRYLVCGVTLVSIWSANSKYPASYIDFSEPGRPDFSHALRAPHETVTDTCPVVKAFLQGSQICPAWLTKIIVSRWILGVSTSYSNQSQPSAQIWIARAHSAP